MAEQTGADVERVQELEKVCELIHVELNAGDNFRPYIHYDVSLTTNSVTEPLIFNINNNNLLVLGDALFFHCNVLHTSSDNTSGNQRRALVIAYNRASNDPGPHEKHPGYTPLHIVNISHSHIESNKNIYIS